MEGRRRILAQEEMGEIKKVPWKPEEDQVLRNHVRKYGPRHWSSIRSKGLLRRTGKSCRLRWVNKLRPNLKTGMKFLAEEERTVIELQAEFGNKWARIATHLPGRTDNDVKNLGTSRQKRLARMLPTAPNRSPPWLSSSSSSSTKPCKNTSVPLQPPVSYLNFPTLETPKFSSSQEEQTRTAKSKFFRSSSIDYPDMVKMAPFAYRASLVYKPDKFQLDYGPPDKKSTVITDQQQLQPDFPLLLDEPNFLDKFDSSGRSMLGLDIDCLINGFLPIDIFDHISSPSEWS